MSIRKFLEPANSTEQLQAQLRDQELSFGMEVLGIGIFETNDVPPLKKNFVEMTSHIGNNLPELQVRVVPPEIGADEASFSTFFKSLIIITANTIVDSARVLISDVEQQIVLFRIGVLPIAPDSAPALPAAPGLAPALPDYARDILSAANGMPWEKSVSKPGMDAYAGVMPGRCRFFQNLKGPEGDAMNAVYYECKFDIDNDGSGGNAAHDPFHSDDTNLHDINGALDANKIAYAVLPLDRSERRVKRPGLTDFGRELGLRPGDLGVAMWREKSVGDVRRVFFIYGDKGPANKLGEGSVHMADALNINSNPNSGGIDSSTMKQLKKGIIHIAFPNSGKSSILGGHFQTTLVPNQIDARAQQLFNSLLHQGQDGPRPKKFEELSAAEKDHLLKVVAVRLDLIENSPDA
jgi:hypothetical protein